MGLKWRKLETKQPLDDAEEVAVEESELFSFSICCLKDEVLLKKTIY